MTDYTELVKALRERALRENEWYEHGGDIIEDAAAAIEALQAEQKKTVTQIFGEEQMAWEGRCKDLMYQITDLQAQLPKRGEWIHGKELSRAYIGNCCVEIVYEDFRCSACGGVVKECEKPKWKYCPNCGAKMTGEQDVE